MCGHSLPVGPGGASMVARRLAHYCGDMYWYWDYIPTRLHGTRASPHSPGAGVKLASAALVEHGGRPEQRQQCS